MLVHRYWINKSLHRVVFIGMRLVVERHLDACLRKQLVTCMAHSPVQGTPYLTSHTCR